MIRQDPARWWQALDENGLPCARVLHPSRPGGRWEVVRWVDEQWKRTDVADRAEGAARAMLYPSGGLNAFGAAEVANAEARAAEMLKREQTARQSRRSNEPLPAGSLFDETSRAQQPLF